MAQLGVTAADGRIKHQPVPGSSVLTGRQESREPQKWLLITSRASWTRLQAAGEWAFAPKHQRKAEAIQPGDEAIVYLTIDREGGSSVGGIVRFTGPVRRVAQERILFDRLYPWRVPMKAVRSLDEPVPFPQFIDNLEFITHKSWGSHLQGQPAKLLSEHDYRLLADAIAEAGAR